VYCDYEEFFGKNSSFSFDRVSFFSFLKIIVVNTADEVQREYRLSEGD